MFTDVAVVLAACIISLQAPPKRPQTSIRLHGAKTQKTDSFNITVAHSMFSY
jgi:hypothetical protein